MKIPLKSTSDYIVAEGCFAVKTWELLPSTLPKTSSSPLKNGGWENTFLFGQFSGAKCSFREGYLTFSFIPGTLNNHKKLVFNQTAIKRWMFRVPGTCFFYHRLNHLNQNSYQPLGWLKSTVRRVSERCLSCHKPAAMGFLWRKKLLENHGRLLMVGKSRKTKRFIP